MQQPGGNPLWSGSLAAAGRAQGYGKIVPGTYPQQPQQLQFQQGGMPLQPPQQQQGAAVYPPVKQQLLPYTQKPPPPPKDEEKAHRTMVRLLLACALILLVVIWLGLFIPGAMFAAGYCPSGSDLCSQRAGTLLLVFSCPLLLPCIALMAVALGRQFRKKPGKVVADPGLGPVFLPGQQLQLSLPVPGISASPGLASPRPPALLPQLQQQPHQPPLYNYLPPPSYSYIQQLQLQQQQPKKMLMPPGQRIISVPGRGPMWAIQAHELMQVPPPGPQAVIGDRWYPPPRTWQEANDRYLMRPGMLPELATKPIPNPPIPPHVLAVWQYQQEVHRLQQELSRTQCDKAAAEAANQILSLHYLRYVAGHPEYDAWRAAEDARRRQAWEEVDRLRAALRRAQQEAAASEQEQGLLEKEKAKLTAQLEALQEVLRQDDLQNQQQQAAGTAGGPQDTGKPPQQPQQQPAPPVVQTDPVTAWTKLSTLNSTLWQQVQALRKARPAPKAPGAAAGKAWKRAEELAGAMSAPDHPLTKYAEKFDLVDGATGLLNLVELEKMPKDAGTYVICIRPPDLRAEGADFWIPVYVGKAAAAGGLYRRFIDDYRNVAGSHFGPKKEVEKYWRILDAQARGFDVQARIRRKAATAEVATAWENELLDAYDWPLNTARNPPYRPITWQHPHAHAKDPQGPAQLSLEALGADGQELYPAPPTHANLYTIRLVTELAVLSQVLKPEAAPVGLKEGDGVDTLVSEFQSMLKLGPGGYQQRFKDFAEKHGLASQYAHSNSFDASSQVLAGLLTRCFAVPPDLLGAAGAGDVGAQEGPDESEGDDSKGQSG